MGEWASRAVRSFVGDGVGRRVRRIGNPQQSASARHPNTRCPFGDGQIRIRRAGRRDPLACWPVVAGSRDPARAPAFRLCAVAAFRRARCPASLRTGPCRSSSNSARRSLRRVVERRRPFRGNQPVGGRGPRLAVFLALGVPQRGERGGRAVGRSLLRGLPSTRRIGGSSTPTISVGREWGGG